MNAGILLILVFVAAGAARDVFFGAVFQAHRFFDVVLVAFGLATLVFAALVAARQRGQVRVLGRAWRELIAVNLGTAAAWLSFFSALKLLEPAVVQTLHLGMGSVTLVAASRLGLHIARPAAVRPLETVLQGLILVTLAALAFVVLAGLSGLPPRPLAENVLGIACALGSGVFISLSTDVTKRMNEKGVSPEAVLAARFLAIVAIAGAAVVLQPPLPGGGGGGADGLGVLALAAMALIVLPLYALQAGLARTSSVSAWVLMALGPAMVFVLQGADARLAQSPYTLACILVYSGLAVAANLARRFERAPIKVS